MSSQGMLFIQQNMNMTCKYRKLKDSVLNESKSDKDYEAPVDLKCWIMDNSYKFEQQADGFNKNPKKAYILSPDSGVKVGDILDNMYVKRVIEQPLFNGQISHLEAFTY